MVVLEQERERQRAIGTLLSLSFLVVPFEHGDELLVRDGGAPPPTDGGAVTCGSGVWEAREDLEEEIVAGDGRQAFGQACRCRFGGFWVSFLAVVDHDHSLLRRLLMLKHNHRQQQYLIIVIRYNVLCALV